MVGALLPLAGETGSVDCPRSLWLTTVWLLAQFRRRGLPLLSVVGCLAVSSASMAWARSAEAASWSQVETASEEVVSEQVVSEVGSRRVAQIERGITGTYTFVYDGPQLRVRSLRDADAALIVRLRQLAVNQYEASFIGLREGNFDLSQTLEHRDGRLATLPPLMVDVISTLPDDQRSDLFEAIEFQPQFGGGYRLALGFALGLWLLVPLALFVVRHWRRPAAVEPPAPPRVPTWGERLKPLLTAAVSRSLSAEEQRQLELLLLHYWRERSGSVALDMAASIRELRQHPEAGLLVRKIEQWLHRQAPNGRSPADIKQLLESLRGELSSPLAPHQGDAA